MINPAGIWWISCQAYRRRQYVMARCLKTLNYFLFRCLLPFEADVARDVELSHWALGVVIHPNVTIGRGVRIYHNVTLAAETWVGSPYRISVGDRVTIGVGAIVIGRGNRNLVIGDDAVIGAGAVVIDDVGRGQVVVGVPARPLPPKHKPDTLPISGISGDR